MFTRFTHHAAVLGALLALVLSGTALAQERDGSTIALGVGTQKVITVPGIARIALGDPNVAEVKNIGNNQVLIIGQTEGKTTLIIWKGSGQRVTFLIAVRRQDPNEIISEIKKLLGEIEGVSVRMVGDRIYLDGQAYTTQDADRIEQVVSLYPNVKSFVKIAPNAKKLVAQNLNAAYQKAGLRNVQANVVGSTIFLEGSVESQQDLQKAELITKAIGEKVENLLVVGIKRMILSEVQFVEIRRNSRDRYGIRYPTDISGTATATAAITKELFPGTFSSGAAALGFNAGADFAVGFQANDGYGRLLAQPKLVCASGEKAEFLAGGEVPIPLITNNQFTVEYKPYGVILNLRPTADRSGNIQTEIEAEASEIDTSVAVSIGGSVAVPGFRTRKVKTNVTVRHGETIVLSGVFSHDEQKAVSKLPGLGHIPIIGELFKNRAFDSTKRELVIFVTPRIVNPDSDKIRTIIEDVKSRYKQARSEVNFNIFD
ncbi:pilus assembly protein N-terminal domain-containing protein [Stigmatella sp. ncwal1]|uniref:Pilus assembly protein N-terminal domain-containing protein n=1 Tax=Stigmatella ashevillensis TaxID=2995309 RepID=A0ABT5D5I6_9BACT|nr:pilus assembly protein N-terminal domain-containing protein [Stigmatella ashevillena]MDC0708324.1 pilus assembly protein N-terminal domain-containing protein [Stigmatella ashevillena]